MNSEERREAWMENRIGGKAIDRDLALHAVGNTVEERAAALRTIAVNATSLEDCAHLIAALGLTAADRRPS